MDLQAQRELITKFADAHPAIHEFEFIRKHPDGVKIEAISQHGMVNYIFRVSYLQHNESIIIKYGTETMRLDPSEKVSLFRQDIEYAALNLLQTIDGKCVPQAYCHDKTLDIIAMEDLGSMELLGNQLRRGHISLSVATTIGKLLGKIHRTTSRTNVNEETWNTWIQYFRKQENIDYYKDYMFTRIFDEDDHINKISAEVLPTFRKCVKTIRENSISDQLGNLFSQDLCFIHGDCHLMAIFVTDHKAKIFDLEFAFLSHPGQNLAMTVISYPLCMMEAYLRPEINPQEILVSSKKALENLVEAYLVENDEVSPSVFLPELSMFCGAAIFFFTNFVVLDAYVSIAESQKIELLIIATDLMISHSEITEIDQLLQHMLPEYSTCLNGEV